MRTKIQNDEHWHELRRANIGGTEASTLMGVPKYEQTEYKLFHIKKGNLKEHDISDNVRVLIGKCLEDGIAKAIATHFKKEIRKVNEYVTDDECAGAGCTLDFEMFDDDTQKWVPFEIKNVDFIQYKKEWADDGDGIEPPLHIDIQMQQQIACTGSEYGYIGALVGGNQPILIRRPRHDAVIQKMRNVIRGFWKRVEDGHEPAVTGDDYAPLRDLFMREPRDDIQDRDDPEVDELCARYLEALDGKKQAEDLVAELKAKIIHQIAFSGTVHLAGHVVKSWKKSRAYFNVEKKEY